MEYSGLDVMIQCINYVSLSFSFNSKTFQKSFNYSSEFSQVILILSIDEEKNIVMSLYKS